MLWQAASAVVEWKKPSEAYLTQEAKDKHKQTNSHGLISSSSTPCKKSERLSLNLDFLICIKDFGLGWRDGSAVKSTDCSSRSPEFNSQQPHGGSQPSVMGSDALFWWVWRQWQYTYTYMHKINKQIFKNK